MSVSDKIKTSIEKSSWIRKMFEEGARLKAEAGEDNVFDFSLGNPDIDPPEDFFNALKNLAAESVPGIHGYMPNAGFPDVRSKVAERVSSEHGVSLSDESIVMTCGAAGGLNIIFKTLLNPGDQVIVPSPYFVEYGFYIDNHGGEMVLVETNDDFSLNINNIRNAINKKTKAILITSPHNPTGKVYGNEEIDAISDTLRKYSSGEIFLLSDEPYREIVYDGKKVPSILKSYSHSILVTSYSKTLSIPGERIGYVAVNPKCKDFSMIMGGLVLSNRILGFVNAPALMQRAVSMLTGSTVDRETYQRRRDLLSDGLSTAGYEFNRPDGAFYIFAKSPVPDDMKFVNHLLKYNILAVPGTGFGKPGYFRLAFCIPDRVIENSLPRFKEAMENL
jgi:aspartate aminotransferase